MSHLKHVFRNGGSNFKGADSSLRKIVRSSGQNIIANVFLEGSYEWYINTARANQRGYVWERIITSTSGNLRSFPLQKVLTDESLKTFLIEAE